MGGAERNFMEGPKEILWQSRKKFVRLGRQKFLVVPKRKFGRGREAILARDLKFVGAGPKED